MSAHPTNLILVLSNSSDMSDLRVNPVLNLAPGATSFQTTIDKPRWNLLMPAKSSSPAALRSAKTETDEILPAKVGQDSKPTMHAKCVQLIREVLYTVDPRGQALITPQTDLRNAQSCRQTAGAVLCTTAHTYQGKLAWGLKPVRSLKVLFSWGTWDLGLRR